MCVPPSGWIGVKYLTSIRGSQTMNPTDAGDPLTFSLAPPAGGYLCYLVKYCSDLWMNGTVIWQTLLPLWNLFVCHTCETVYIRGAQYVDRDLPVDRRDLPVDRGVVLVDRMTLKKIVPPPCNFLYCAKLQQK